MNIFQWLAGGDQDILDQCSKSENSKIRGMGSMVLIPAVVGIFSMTYTISTLTTNKVIWFLVGIVWFFVLIAFDRFIVSTLFKSKLESRTNYVFAVLIRLIFSITLGLVISHPVVLWVYNSSINERIVNEIEMELREAEAQYREDFTEISSTLNDMIALKNCRERLLTAELSGVKLDLDCGSSSGLPNAGHRAGELRRQIEDINGQIKIEEQRVNNSLSLLSEQKEKMKDNIEEHKSFDYMKRVQVLSQLENDDVSGSGIKVVRLVIILFFIFLDILPITMKLALPFGEYEAVRDSIIYKTLMTKEAENKATMLHANTVLPQALAVKLKHENLHQEIKDIEQLVRDVQKEMDEERKNSQKLTEDILADIKSTQNVDLRSDYTSYLVSVRNVYSKTYQKLHSKLLGYINSL